MDINIKGYSQPEFRVEYPYLTTSHSLQKDFDFIPTNAYHGGFREGSPGVSIYGFAAKQYIGGDTYLKNIPSRSQIITTFWMDKDKDKDKETNLFQTQTLNLPEIIWDIHSSCLILEEDTSYVLNREEASPVLLRVYDMMKRLVPDRVYPKVIGKDVEELCIRLERLDEILDKYDRVGSIDTHDLLDIVTPLKGRSSFDDLSLTHSERILRDHSSDKENSQLIILGTSRGESDFKIFLQETQEPGIVNTVGLIYNRFYPNQYIPNPAIPDPLAKFYTPVRSFEYKTSPAHAYAIDGVDDTGLHLADSVVYSRQFPYPTFINHYATDATSWDFRLKESPIIEFKPTP